MINLVIILLVAVGASGVAIYSAYSFFNTSQAVTDQQLDQARLEEAASAITANLMEIDGTFFAPAGVNGTDYMQVPSWVTPNARTVSNIPFLYCPYAALNGTGTASTTVELPGVSNYAIQTYSSPYTSNRAYVVSSVSPSSAAPDGTLAVLVAPAANSTVPADCTNLIVDATGHLVLNGASGSVVAITAGQFFKERANAAQAKTYIYVSLNGTGDYSGRDVNNAMTLRNAMQWWRAVKPRFAELWFTNGSYTADATTFPAAASSNRNPGERNQVLFFRGGGSVTITTSTNITSFVDSLYINSISWNMAGYDLNIEGGDKVTINATTFGVKDLNIYDGAFNLIGNQINASGNITVHPDGNFAVAGSGVIAFSAAKSLSIYGYANISNANFQNINNSTPILVQTGGRLDLTSTILTASSGNLYSGIEVASGGLLNQITGGTVTFNQAPLNYAVGVRGTALWSGNLVFNASGGNYVVIQLAEGGRLGFFGGMGSTTVAAQRPSTGIYDAGGSQIWGSGTVRVNAGATLPACWSGAVTPNLFSRSPEGNGTFSDPSSTGYDYLQIDNGSRFSCVKT